MGYCTERFREGLACGHRHFLVDFEDEGHLVEVSVGYVVGFTADL